MRSLRGHGLGSLGWSSGDKDLAFVTEGMLDGTLIATAEGWRRVEQISPGDRVLTFDGGPQTVIAVQSAIVEAGWSGWPRAHWPLVVPDDALGNRGPLRLLPGQPVLLESDLAEDMFGDPFALIPAAALEGWRGIAPAPPMHQETVRLLILPVDEVVYVAGHMLLYCPADNATGLPGFGAAGDRGAARAGYAPLSLASAREFVACLIAEDVGAALRGAAPDGSQAALRALSP
ncbi:Hint domain-containing protein [Gemmobacter megaterium]|uniref:Hint domain-containing protein n=1 Tax=Gemmobacter megaterium TaxID=1086013 RepID=UPI00135652B0|nr:Hint domain-containing protein [Gemmobacter megaterium]